MKRLALLGAGIDSLSGIEAFPELEALIIPGNAIQDLKPLWQLPTLRYADLRDNPLDEEELECRLKDGNCLFF